MESPRQGTGITHVALRPHPGEVSAGSQSLRQTSTARTGSAWRQPASVMVRGEYRDSGLGKVLFAWKHVSGRSRLAELRTQPAHLAGSTELGERPCLRASVALATGHAWNEQ
jgi:hypothetical protein